MFEKARSRREQVQEKMLKELENRRQTLQQKLEVAQTRKQIELQNVQQRAVEQNQRIEDTMFINKLTKENQKLDLDEKMSEI